MKNEMKTVLESIPRIKTVEEVIKCFRGSCERFEEFLEDEEDFGEYSFEDLFSYCCCKELKRREDEIIDESLKNRIESVDPNLDIILPNENEKSRKTGDYNLVLISSDGKEELKVHKEIMILKYNFFLLMFRFDGSEIREFEKTGKITLDGIINSEVLNEIVEFAYSNKLKLGKTFSYHTLETIIKILIHSNKFDEVELFQECVCFLKELDDEINEDEFEKMNAEKSILEILRRDEIGSLIHNNETILEHLLPVFKSLLQLELSEDVRKMIEKSVSNDIMNEEEDDNDY